MLAETKQSKQATSENAEADIERIKIIEAVIEEIRPNLQRDGGDCALVSVEGNKIMVKLTGACVFCKLAGMTLEGIQAKVVERLGELVRIVPVPGGGGPTQVPLGMSSRPVLPQRPE
jgi:Fe-S cluster biogenesis protein NfuA